MMITVMLVTACFGGGEPDPDPAEAAKAIRRDAAELFTILPLLGGQPRVIANADKDIECDGGVRREYRAVAPVIQPMKSQHETEIQVRGVLRSLGYTSARGQDGGVLERRKESIRTDLIVEIKYLEEITVRATTDCL